MPSQLLAKPHAARDGAEGSAAASIRRLLLLLPALLLASGCETASQWLKGQRTAEPEPVVAGEQQPEPYLGELYALAIGDPATQAEIYADAKSRAELTPDPSTRLRYALVLATPGHSGSDASLAQHIFRELLAQPELMTTNEIALATIHLRSVEENIMLGAETNRLRSENSRAASTEEAALAQRAAAVETENRRLRESLAEAEAKLEAISSIERTIRGQNDN